MLIFWVGKIVTIHAIYVPALLPLILIKNTAVVMVCVLQYVHLKYALEAAPDGEEERVEGAVPGPGSQVGVEGRGHHGFLIPLQLLVLDAAVASRGSQCPGRPGSRGCGVDGSDRANLRHVWSVKK